MTTLEPPSTNRRPARGLGLVHSTQGPVGRAIILWMGILVVLCVLIGLIL
ncbi:hypothetical protein [Corynebacterium renale]|nr:hypothetical protein [Corynebacterium renale]